MKRIVIHGACPAWALPIAATLFATIGVICSAHATVNDDSFLRPETLEVVDDILVLHAEADHYLRLFIAQRNKRPLFNQGHEGLWQQWQMLSDLMPRHGYRFEPAHRENPPTNRDDSAVDADTLVSRKTTFGTLIVATDRNGNILRTALDRTRMFRQKPMPTDHLISFLLPLNTRETKVPTIAGLSKLLIFPRMAFPSHAAFTSALPHAFIVNASQICIDFQSQCVTKQLLKGYNSSGQPEHTKRDIPVTAQRWRRWQQMLRSGKRPRVER